MAWGIFIERVESVQGNTSNHISSSLAADVPGFTADEGEKIL